MDFFFINVDFCGVHKLYIFSMKYVGTGTLSGVKQEVQEQRVHQRCK